MEPSPEIVIRKCQQALCNIATNGSCLEGLSPEECPYYELHANKWTSDILDETDEITSSTSIETDSTFLKVYSGDELDINGANLILSDELTNVVILAGDVDAGKTTLLTSIMDVFQQKLAFAGYIFRGSKTLIGFEKRAHLSRIESGRTSAETARTAQLEPRFLHLSLQSETSKFQTRSVLISDISGELFKQIKNSAEAAENFHLAQRADHFVLLIDANSLSTPLLRQTSKRNAITLLQRLVTAKKIGLNTFVDIVYSKWDLLLEKQESTHIDFVNSVEEEIKKNFSFVFNSMTFHKVASRPLREDKVARGFGLEKLFKSWANQSIWIEQTIELADYKPKGFSKREFSAYKFQK